MKLSKTRPQSYPGSEINKNADLPISTFHGRNFSKHYLPNSPKSYNIAGYLQKNSSENVQKKITQDKVNFKD
jgi:hypothetical protein